MIEPQTGFKPPPRRHQPKGLTLLFEDRDILVVDKASGLLTVGNDKDRERTAYCLLTNYVRKGNSKSNKRIFIVHRLDQDTSGVLIFAKHAQAKRYLQGAWHDFKKVYYALVLGALPEKEGIMESYLAENKAHRMYSVRDPKQGKLSRTRYRVVKESKRGSLLEIDLLTGRKNQIRVHLAEKGFPVVGDKKYGPSGKGKGRLALHAASLTMRHPHSKETVRFTAELPAFMNSLAIS